MVLVCICVPRLSWQVRAVQLSHTSHLTTANHRTEINKTHHIWAICHSLIGWLRLQRSLGRLVFYSQTLTFHSSSLWPSLPYQHILLWHQVKTFKLLPVYPLCSPYLFLSPFFSFSLSFSFSSPSFLHILSLSLPPPPTLLQPYSDWWLVQSPSVKRSVHSAATPLLTHYWWGIRFLLTQSSWAESWLASGLALTLSYWAVCLGDFRECESASLIKTNAAERCHQIW